MVWLRVPYLLLKQRNARGQNQNAQTQGQQDFPSYLHELVKAISRERATIPDIEVHERGNFRREPENILHPQADRRIEQDQSDEGEQDAKYGEADGLNAEQGMLGHARRVKETDC